MKEDSYKSTTTMTFRFRIQCVLILLCVIIFGYLIARSRTFQALLHPPAAPAVAPLILIWDRQSHLLDHKPYRSRSEVPNRRLSCGCDITSDPGAWKLADAVLVNAFYLRRVSDFAHFFPKRRIHNQLWIFYMLEPAQIITENRDKSFFHHLNGQFNLTMTYRRDSDIPIGYGLIHPYYVDDPENNQMPEIQVYQDFAKNKTHLVAWFASNCQAKSARLDYVRELQRYLAVDIYGDCGALKCPNATVTDCNKLLTDKYKFYLSFESSVCKDYITEKFFNPMQQIVVPVVLGGGNYSAINAPRHSYIDIGDFRSIKELADYLLYLDATPTAYNAYLEWKRQWKVERSGVYSDNLCQLCDKLKTITVSSANGPVFQKVYPDMTNWWHAQAKCRRGQVKNGTWITLP